ncbi:histidine phosphatase family protein [Rhodococcus sp. 06-418-5]|uniref:histidine phosphatase family protein n=1 Tax=Nocardiaceae TaxID=85025 RepID=UPI00050C5FE1|nr:MULTISPECIES: histidine phosphatase family protein [Rhodococcus]OZC85965.1 histidine phosphatase family protein [Rhodococcus sp. 06-418-5]OZD79510.1 histidine phosphatase family protein [Rhodococcus sp. 05-339-2]
MMGKLILVRHGQTTANVAKVLDTSPPGAELTELGHQQAEAYAQTWIGRPPAVLVSSVALRAKQTAGYIERATGVPLLVTEGIQETFAGDLEDRDDPDAHREFTEIFSRWHAGDLAATVPGGDSGHSVLERYVPVLDGLRAQYLGDDTAGDVVVVSHGAAIRLVAAVLAGVEGTFAADNHLDNTHTVELLPLPDGGWSCVRWGTFLPPFEGKGSDKADNPIS